MKELVNKIRRKWMKLRLQPIYVFCFHHVCETFDAASMNQRDWMQIDEFKQKVLKMQQDGVEFISLKEAYNKITNDKFRNHKYAVLTFDDGYASLNEILPWLEGQNIPATLFINGKYLDGKSFRDNPKPRHHSLTTAVVIRPDTAGARSYPLPNGLPCWSASLCRLLLPIAVPAPDID